MKLNLQEKRAYKSAEKILIDNGLTKSKEYAFSSEESSRLRGIDGEVTLKLNVTFPETKVIIDSLKQQNWEIEKRYKNNGDPSIFSSDIHCDASELSELIFRFGREVKMIRMVYKGITPKTDS